MPAASAIAPSPRPLVRVLASSAFACGVAAALDLVACGGGGSSATDAPRAVADAARPDAARPDGARASRHHPKQPLEPSERLPPHRRYPDAASALLDMTPPGMRVLGVGEMHVRSDRIPARSALSVFTAEVMPIIGGRVSDLVLETWIVDKKCQAKGAAASRRIEQAMKRPAETQRELGTGIKGVSGSGVKVHALRMTCDDYDVVAPEIGGIQAEKLLSLVTRELGRIASSAVVYRDKRAREVPADLQSARPWIAVYGGALHNDRDPLRSLAEWSYAGAVDVQTGDRFMEIDLIVPELAAQDPASQNLSWAELVHETPPGSGVVAFERGERSVVIILTRGAQ